MAMGDRGEARRHARVAALLRARHQWPILTMVIA